MNLGIKTDKNLAEESEMAQKARAHYWASLQAAKDHPGKAQVGGAYGNECGSSGTQLSGVMKLIQDHIDTGSAYANKAAIAQELKDLFNEHPDIARIYDLMQQL